MTREIELHRISKWEKVTQALVDEFVLKYFGEDADAWWVADRVGDVFHVNSYFFDLSYMMTALKLNATFEQIVDYYDLTLEAFSNKKKIGNFENYIKHGITYV